MPTLNDITLSVGGNFAAFNQGMANSVRAAQSQLAGLRFDSRSWGALGTISRDMNQFQKSLEAASARVLAFGLSAGAFYALKRGIQAVIVSAVDVEKQFAEINLVLNLSSKGLERFGQQVFRTARETGQSFKTTALAFQELSRQGLGVEETQKRARDALILTRITGLDVESAISSLTAVIKTFSDEALNSTKIINTLAAVDQAFAISSKDLVEALRRVGNVASTVGVDFKELISLITAIKERTGQAAPVIGNALKTIFTRLESPTRRDVLRRAGIDVSGDAISTLRNMGMLFESGKMSKEQMAVVKELAAGVYQIDRFTALLKDLSSEVSIYGNAWKVANTAQDNAIEKNERLNKTLNSQINALKNNLLQFSATVGESGGGAPLRTALGGLNLLFGTFNDKEPQEMGAKIGKGIITGIGQVFTGPVLATTFAVIGIYIARFARDLGRVAQSILQVNTPLQQRKLLEQQIAAILETQPGLVVQLLNGERTALQVETEILNVLTRQNAQRVYAIDAARVMASRITIPTGQETLARIGQANTQSFQPQFIQARSLTGQFAGSIRRQIQGLSQFITIGQTWQTQNIENAVAGAVLSARKGTIRRQDFGAVAQNIATRFDPLSQTLAPNIAQILGNATLLTPRIANKLNIQLQAMANDALNGGTHLRELNRVLLSIIKKANLTDAHTAEILAISERNAREGFAASNVGGTGRGVVAVNNAERRRRIMSSVGFGLGIGIPMAAGVAQQYIPGTNKSGRVAQSAVSGIGDMATYGFLGSMIIPGGIGTALGILIGSGLTISKIIEQWSTKLPELEGALEAAREQTSLLSDRLNTFVKDAETLKRVQSGELKLSPMEISDTRRRMFQTLATQFTGGERGKAAGLIARGDIEGLNDLMYTKISRQQKLQMLEGARLSLGQFFEQKGSASKTVDQFLGLTDITLLNEQTKREKTKSLISNVLQLPTEEVRTTAEIAISGKLFKPARFQGEQLKDVSEIFKSMGLDTQSAMALTRQFENAPIGESLDLFRALLRVINQHEEGLKELINEQNKIDPQGKLVELRQQISAFNTNLDNVITSSKIGTEAKIMDIMNANALTQIQEKAQIDALRATALPFEIGGNITERLALKKENISRIQRIAAETESERARAAEQFSGKVLQTTKLIDSEKLEGKEKVFGGEDLSAIRELQKKLANLAQEIINGEITPKTQFDKTISDFAILSSPLRGKGEKIDENLNALMDELKSAFNEFRGVTQNIDDNEKGLIKISEAQLKAQELLVKLQEQINQRTVQQYFDGKAFKDAFIQARTNIRYNRILEGAGSREVLGGAGQAFADEWRTSIQDMYKELQDGAADLAASMKSSFKDAFKSFIDGSRNAEEALRDFGLAVFNKLLDRSLDAGINALFGGVTAAGSAFYGSYIKKSAEGGYVQRFASGGLVHGGSGYKDDVPARLNAGEFIIKKSSVQKYGTGFLDSLNKTNTKKFEEGGVNVSLANRFDYNDPRRPTAGQRVIDPNLSNFALSDEDSVKNNLRIAREDALSQYLSDWNEYERQNKEAMNAFKREQRQRLIGAYISAVANVGGAYLGKTFGKAGTPTQSPTTRYGPTYGGGPRVGTVSDRGVSWQPRSAGGPADNVPALLMGGEYVMSRPAVQKYGTDFFHKLNSGQLPKFQMGGSVGGNIGSNPSNFTSAPVNNHIEVNVTVNNNEVSKAESRSTSNDPNQSDKERGKLLGEAIQSSIIAVINKESRDGGLLAQSFVRRR